MKDHRKFYNCLRFMAVVNIAVGGFFLIVQIIRLIESRGTILQDFLELPSSLYEYHLKHVML